MENFVRQNAVKESLGKIIEEQGEKWITIKCHSQVSIRYFVHLGWAPPLTIFINQQKIHAIPFYEKLGYVAKGPQFDEDGGTFPANFSPHRPYNDIALAPHQLLVHRLQVDDDYKSE